MERGSENLSNGARREAPTSRPQAEPFFSVIIPTFNRCDLLRFAIASVLRQTFDDFELIVCDNFSEDATPAAVQAFPDPRIRYLRTPRHLVIADSWEFARSHATGTLIVVLADDDVLLSTALETFAEQSRRHDADFLLATMAEYRDLSFPGAGRNTLRTGRYSGTARVIDVAEFLDPLYDFHPRYNMHPSAFAFGRTLAAAVADKVGRFFQTNGVEYCAWPLAAVQAKRIVWIELPLVVAGRTGKSWGANVVLGNPGKKRIDQFIADVDHRQQHAPLHNFTFCNLIAEGILTAKSLLPAEFARYQFSEMNYLRETFYELRKRRALGVDVAREMNELRGYTMTKYPPLWQELAGGQRRRIRSLVGDLGIRRLRAWMSDRRRTLRDTQKVRAGHLDAALWMSGREFGFDDILEATRFLESTVSAVVRTRGADREHLDRAL